MKGLIPNSDYSTLNYWLTKPMREKGLLGFYSPGDVINEAYLSFPTSDILGREFYIQCKKVMTNLLWDRLNTYDPEKAIVRDTDMCCSKCKKVKNKSEFRFRMMPQGGRKFNSWCKDCHGMSALIASDQYIANLVARQQTTTAKNILDNHPELIKAKRKAILTRRDSLNQQPDVEPMFDPNWKAIPGLNERFWISNEGQVYNYFSERLVMPDERGFIHIGYTARGIDKTVSIQRLMKLTFELDMTIQEERSLIELERKTRKELAQKQKEKRKMRIREIEKIQMKNLTLDEILEKIGCSKTTFYRYSNSSRIIKRKISTIKSKKMGRAKSILTDEHYEVFRLANNPEMHSETVIENTGLKRATYFRTVTRVAREQLEQVKDQNIKFQRKQKNGWISVTLKVTDKFISNFSPFRYKNYIINDLQINCVDKSNPARVGCPSGMRGSTQEKIDQAYYLLMDGESNDFIISELEISKATYFRRIKPYCRERFEDVFGVTPEDMEIPMIESRFNREAEFLLTYFKKIQKESCKDKTKNKFQNQML